MTQENHEIESYWYELPHAAHSANKIPKSESLNITKLSETIQEAIKLFSLQSESFKEDSVMDYVLNRLISIKNITYFEDNVGNIGVTKSSTKLNNDEFYPCIVCHMDTAHEFVKKKEVIVTKEDNKTIISSPTGIGGDDLCGVYAALKLIEELPTLKVIFTVAEENGGIGADRFINNEKEFFNDIGYMIEIDRKGNSDLITDICGKICSKEFLQVIKPNIDKYGFKETYGITTDIDIFKDIVNISAINVSSGYYNPHSKDEIIVWEDLLHSIDFVKSCILSLGLKNYPHTRITSMHYNSPSKGMTYYDIEDECCCDISPGIDITCPICNPVKNLYYETCPNCGELLEDRLHTFNCKVCNCIFLKRYY